MSGSSRLKAGAVRVPLAAPAPATPRMTLILSSLILWVIIWMGREYWSRLYREHDPWPNPAWLRGWIIKGVAVPVVVWCALNCELIPFFPPLWSVHSVARYAQISTFSAFCLMAAAGMLMVGFFWGIVSFGWLLVEGFARTPPANYPEYKSFTVLGLLLSLLLAGSLFYFGSWGVGSMVLFVGLAFIAHLTTPLIELKKPPPVYSGAVGKMKLGKIPEAEWAILDQLEHCEDDFEGWLLLAELYAVHYHDLPAARQAIYDLCAQPNLTPSQVSVALHRYADWQLKLSDDPLPAREALETICASYPDTHLAHMARQRLDQVPQSREELAAQRQPRRIRLPTGITLKSEPRATPSRLLSRDAARQEAEQCARQLRANPNDVATRERLAQLWTEYLGEPVSGLEELDRLLAIPGQPAERRAEWLGRMAEWQLKYCRDDVGARLVLERLVAEFPQTQPAVEARRRLHLMDAEQKLRRRLAETFGPSARPGNAEKPLG